MEYSDFTKFSPNRKEVYLTLKDGGFGDADGIANGIIVDPLTFGSESDPKSDNSESPIDEFFDGIVPDGLGCFIGTTAGEFSKFKLNALKLRRPVLGLMLILVLALLSYVAITRFSRLAKSVKQNRPKRESILPWRTRSE
jgi:hypothetical protein